MIVYGLFIVLINLIVFTCFGVLVTAKKGKPLSLGLSVTTGFFVYYGMFFIVCFPFMVKYRPLTWLTKTWLPIVAIICIGAVVLRHKQIVDAFVLFKNKVIADKKAFVAIFVIVFIQVILVSVTYNFTLDAAYYVSNVTTSIETNMINVYDPFTGNWQDHYEIRYLLATYSVNDAVICQFTKLPALIYTKLVMNIVVILLVNTIYFMIASELFDDEFKSVAIMMAVILFVNLTFASIFTSSLFLLTRTYEGKTVVGNLSLLAVFYIFMNMMQGKTGNIINRNNVKNIDIAQKCKITTPWLILFIISFGSMTISSSANMVLPAAISLFALPYMIINKTIKPALKFFACVLPGIIMVVAYILYVKGVFVLYTYPVF